MILGSEAEFSTGRAWMLALNLPSALTNAFDAIDLSYLD